MGCWTVPEKPCNAPFMDLISKVIHEREWTDPDLLPNLKDSAELVLASDYTGEHKNSQFQVLGYLLADGSRSIPAWDRSRKTLRAKLLPDNRRIEFKGLGDALKQKALPAFLELANSINGLILCVAIDKRIHQIVPGLISAKDAATMHWKPEAWEKLIRVAIFGSILVSGLARRGQRLLWITDEDVIVANQKRLNDAARIIGGFLWQYCPKRLDDVTIGIAGRFNDDGRAEGLISIVDLAVGSVTESLSLIGPANVPKSSNIFTPIHRHLSTKALLILSWLSRSHVPLKKLILMVRPVDGGLVFSFGNPEVDIGSPLARAMASTQLWLPPDKRWNEVLFCRHKVGPLSVSPILVPSLSLIRFP